MKSNDRIPKDEMKLARMIAATHAKGLKWCAGAPFKKPDMLYVTYEPEEATHVCAIGAMYLAGDITLKTAFRSKSKYLMDVYKANDHAPVDFRGAPTTWLDAEESIGYAFRCAMEDV